MSAAKRATADGGQTQDDKVSALDILSIAESLTATVDLDELLKKISRAAEELLDSEASSIMLLTDDKKSLFFKAASEKSGHASKKMTIPVGTGVAGWVAANGRPEMVSDVRTDKRFADSFDKDTGFVTRSLICVPMLYRGETMGVVEVLNRRAGPYTKEHVRLLSGLANLASAAVANARFSQDQHNFFSRVLDLLGGMIEVAKPRMEGHPARAARLACAIGKALELDEHSYRMLYYAGYLHDIGYVAMKSPRFAASMGLAQMGEESHPTASVKMLEGINILEGALPMIQHHHECFDGTGFPGKLKADEIPLGARILFLVESLEELRMMGGLEGDALLSRAAQEAKDGAGSRYDPEVVSAAVELLENYKGVW